jgi:hypothetical protein
MTYKIKVSYRTGDSFKTYDEEVVLPIENENVDIAKENLQRIKTHYDWVQSLNRWSKEPKPIPDFVEKHYGNCVQVHAYSTFTEYSINNEAEYYIHLLTDDRTEVKISTSWIGYFEHLYGAEIVSDPEDGWSFRY